MPSSYKLLQGLAELLHIMHRMCLTCSKCDGRFSYNDGDGDDDKDDAGKGDDGYIMENRNENFSYLWQKRKEMGRKTSI